MATVVKLNPTPYDSIISKANSILTGSLAPGAIRTTAGQQAAAQLSPQLAAENAASAAQQRLYGEQYTRSTEFAKAMAALREPTAGLASAPFADMAGTMGGIAGGVNNAATGAMTAAHDQASQAVADTAGVGQVNQTYDPSLAASVWQQTGVKLPTDTLSAQAAAAAAGARNASDVTADQIGVIANNLNQQAADALSQHNQTLAQIQAQRPSIFQQALDSLQARRSQAMDTLASLTGNKASYLQNAAQLAEQKREATVTAANAAKQTNIAEQYLNAANKKDAVAMTGIIPGTGGKLAAGYMRDPQGRVVPYSTYVTSLYNQGRLSYYSAMAAARQESANAAWKNAETAGKALTAKQQAAKTASQAKLQSAQNTVFKGASKVAANLAKQLYPTVGGVSSLPTGQLTPADQTKWQQAYVAIYSYLRGSGITDLNTLHNLATQALNTAGLREPVTTKAAGASTTVPGAGTWGIPAAGVFGVPMPPNVGPVEQPSGGAGSRGAF